MGKINITQNKLQALIIESVKKCIKEAYNRNTFYNYHSGISDNKDFMYLEDLVGNFANEIIDYDSETRKANFESFIEGLSTLKQMSEEKRDFDKMNVKDLYQQYVSEGKEDDFWSLDIAYEYEYLDNYVGEYAKTELWDKYMPAPERVDYLINQFKNDLELYYKYEIDHYQREMWSNYRYYMKELNNIPLK